MTAETRRGRISGAERAPHLPSTVALLMVNPGYIVVATAETLDLGMPVILEFSGIVQTFIVSGLVGLNQWTRQRQMTGGLLDQLDTPPARSRYYRMRLPE